MNNRVNYTLIGFLVIIGFTLISGFSYWLAKSSKNIETAEYIIYFDESVLGLNIDSAVKYRGINVGKVSELKINPNNSEQVEALVTILKSTPIKSSTVATLTSQGITGLSYINLSLGDNNAPPIEVKEGEKRPIIKSKPSFFERFGNSVDAVSTKLSNTLSGTQKLLNDENQKQFAIILKRTAVVMEKLDKVLNEETIVNVQKSVKNLESSSAKLDRMMPHIDVLTTKSIAWQDEIARTFNSIMNSYLGIRSSADTVKKAVDEGQFNFKKMSGDIVPTINDSLLEMQHLMIKLEDLLNQYERSPSDILFKEEKIKKGPGEK
jgi:phospholipid/cholesterol/gamma-HCH transport system substrate-binding protein